MNHLAKFGIFAVILIITLLQMRVLSKPVEY